MRANGALRRGLGNIREKFTRNKSSVIKTPWSNDVKIVKPRQVKKAAVGRTYGRSQHKPRNHSTMLTVDERLANYYAQCPDRPLTPAQRKRVRRKMNARAGSRG
jgi:hypothetical protein